MKKVFIFILFLFSLIQTTNAQIEGLPVSAFTGVLVEDNTAPQYRITGNYLSFQSYPADSLQPGDVYLMEYAINTPREILAFDVDSVQIISGLNCRIWLTPRDGAPITFSTSTGVITKPSNLYLFMSDANAPRGITTAAINRNFLKIDSVLNSAGINTNFAQDNLTFTGNRVHNLDNNTLRLTNVPAAAGFRVNDVEIPAYDPPFDTMIGYWLKNGNFGGWGFVDSLGRLVVTDGNGIFDGGNDGDTTQISGYVLGQDLTIEGKDRVIQYDSLNTFRLNFGTVSPAPGFNVAKSAFQFSGGEAPFSSFNWSGANSAYTKVGTVNWRPSRFNINFTDFLTFSVNEIDINPATGRIEIDASGLLALSGDTIAVGENLVTNAYSLRSTRPSIDSMVQVTNSDGTTSWQPYGGGGGGSDGNGIISALPVGDVDITADSSKFVIDSLGRYKITTETGEFLIATSIPGNGNSILMGKKNPGDAFGNVMIVGDDAAGIVGESVPVTIQSSQDVEIQSSTKVDISAPQTTLSGGNVELSGNNISISPVSSFEIDELSYPFTAPAQDSSALLFNQDGTGYLFDLPEYIANAGGGGGQTGPPVFYDSLETGSIFITAFDSLKIDSVSYYQMTTKGNGYPTYFQYNEEGDKYAGIYVGEETGFEVYELFDGGGVEIFGDELAISPGISFEIDELSYPFTAPAFDTAALVFNQDGSGYLFDLPNYLDQNLGGGIYSGSGLLNGGATGSTTTVTIPANSTLTFNGTGATGDRVRFQTDNILFNGNIQAQGGIEQCNGFEVIGGIVDIEASVYRSDIAFDYELDVGTFSPNGINIYLQVKSRRRLKPYL
jgi:hypothetical protein